MKGHFGIRNSKEDGNDLKIKNNEKITDFIRKKRIYAMLPEQGLELE